MKNLLAPLLSPIRDICPADILLVSEIIRTCTPLECYMKPTVNFFNPQSIIHINFNVGCHSNAD